MRILNACWLGLVFAMPVFADDPRETRSDGCPTCCRAGGGCCQGVGAKGLTATPIDEATPTPEPVGPGMTSSEHGNIFQLLMNHRSITRTVEPIPGGVRTITTTSDPALVETLRDHVRQMTRRVENGMPVRLWDPAFRNVFAHYADIDLEFRNIENGIEVRETSENPEAVAAIRAHAEKVNAFVAKGHDAARPPWAGGRGRGMGFGRGRGGATN